MPPSYTLTCAELVTQFAVHMEYFFENFTSSMDGLQQLRIVQHTGSGGRQLWEPQRQGFGAVGNWGNFPAFEGSSKKSNTTKSEKMCGINSWESTFPIVPGRQCHLEALCSWWWSLLQLQSLTKPQPGNQMSTLLAKTKISQTHVFHPTHIYGKNQPNWTMVTMSAMLLLVQTQTHQFSSLVCTSDSISRKSSSRCWLWNLLAWTLLSRRAWLLTPQSGSHSWRWERQNLN